MKKSQFGGLRPVGKATAAEAPATPQRGRPRGTALDSKPMTLHISDESQRAARIKLLQDADKRPLSRIVELLLNGWTSGKFKLTDV